VYLLARTLLSLADSHFLLAALGSLPSDEEKKSQINNKIGGG
jgi:hypothetical protein